MAKNEVTIAVVKAQDSDLGYHWGVKVDGKLHDQGFTKFHWWAFRKAYRHGRRYYRYFHPTERTRWVIGQDPPPA